MRLIQERNSANVPVVSYSYNGKNELTVVGNGWDCSSDGNGNRNL